MANIQISADGRFDDYKMKQEFEGTQRKYNILWRRHSRVETRWRVLKRQYVDNDKVTLYNFIIFEHYMYKYYKY